MEPKTLRFFRKELELLRLPKDAIEDILKSIEEHYSKVSLPLGQTSFPEIIKVFKEEGPKTSTEISLLVATPTKGTLVPWDRSRIRDALIKEARVSKEEAEETAQAVEKKIFTTDIKTVSTSLIRALVDNELFARGLTKKIAKQRILGMPTFDVKELIFTKTLENSNIAANNPEAVNLAIAETILKQYTLQNIFSEEVAEGHLKGAIHIHDLGYPVRCYCGSHSLEYIKKYGLRLINLDSTSKPATHARTLSGHLNTFLAAMQAYYAGALGIGYLNIFYAPYLVGMTDKQMVQEAQYIIFSGSQNAFSRGGQTLFLDYNIHLGVPNYLKEVPAIGPKGKYIVKYKNGKIERVREIKRDKKGNPINPKGGRILRYKDFEKEARGFAKAMLQVWEEGDADDKPFAFPKCDLHIDKNTFSDPEQYKLFQYACKIASKNGAPYFVFDRGGKVVLSQCCRLREEVTDSRMLKYPESLRFTGFQIITINLPQATYRTKRNGERTTKGVIKEIEKAMDLAIKAHLQKKRFIERIMTERGLPMWQVGKKSFDGKPYVDLDKATYLIGMIGLDECVKALTGHRLHESEEAYKPGLEIIGAMNLKCKKLGKEFGLKVMMEETPAESASLRLARVDLIEYPESKKYIKGNQKTGEVYYTNSVHYTPDAPIDIIQRIEGQAKFNPLIESGAITHCFVGEKLPSPKSIENLIRKTWQNTQSNQIVISPEFTVCQDCRSVSPGFMRNKKAKCPKCGSENAYGFSRIVGYYSRITNWNVGKKAEFRDRQKGNYEVS